jgi:hypothetical protein
MNSRRFPRQQFSDSIPETSDASYIGMSLRKRTRPGSGIKNMRTASLIMLSGLFVYVAHADEIRHATFPNVMLGTWAETAEQCAAKDKTNIVIEATKYRELDR